MIHNSHLTTYNLRFTTHHSSQSGFTLIEVIMYIFFLTLFMGGSISIAYNILRNSQDNRTKIAIEEEGNFLLKKINWVINDVDTIISPLPNTSSPSLTVKKFDFGSNFIVDKVGGVVRLDRGSGPVDLNDSLFVVSSLSFSLVSSGSINTDLLNISFYIKNKKFSLTRYVR